MSDLQKQQRRAGALFLVGLGTPIAVAFIYPFLLGRGRRSSRPAIDLETLSTSEVAVFVSGAGIGILMLVVGLVLLKRR